jgi:hypothetical protein
MLKTKELIILDEETAKRMKEEKVKEQEKALKKYLQECEPVVEDLDIFDDLEDELE